MNAQLGQTLKECRLAAGLSVANLASRLKDGSSTKFPVSGATISRIENGKTVPHPALIDTFVSLDGLNLTADDISQIRQLYEQVSDPVQDRLINDYWITVLDVEPFQGRDDELKRLKQWVVADECRVVGVWGMGGQGKSFLAAKLGETVKHTFEYAIWFSVLNAPPFSELVQVCLQTIDPHHSPLADESVSRTRERLLTAFQNHRCLLIIDNMETVSQNGNDATQYNQFIELMGKVRHQSCLILTSRERPPFFDSLRRKPWVQSLEVSALTPAEAQRLVSDHDLVGSEIEWAQLCELASGNPLILGIMAEDIAHYYQHQIGLALQNPAIFSGEIDKVLAQQFDERSSSLERAVMYWLAIEREGVSLDDLLANLIAPVPEREMFETLRTLERRSLVRREGDGFTMPNVLIEYVTQRLIEKTRRDIQRGDLTRLNRFALLKAQAKQYVRDQQRRVILQPVLTHLRQIYHTEARVSEAIQRIISQLQATPDLPPGYAAGNMLNLLIEGGVDLTGYDFAGLTLRQVQLETVDLHAVNFSYAHFADCTFLHTFGATRSVVFSPNDRLIAAGSNSLLHVWHVATSTLIFATLAHTAWIREVAFSPDGKWLATCSDDHTIKLWDTETWQCGHTRRVHFVAFSPDGKLLASGGDDCLIFLWKPKTGGIFSIYDGGKGRLRQLNFSNQGRYLASCTAKPSAKVKFWDTTSGECIRTVDGNFRDVRNVTFLPNSDIVASTGEDGCITLWNIVSGECILSQPILESTWFDSLSFSPNGCLLAISGGDTVIHVWNMAQKKLHSAFVGHKNLVRSVVFASRGNILLSSSDDRTIKLWDCRTYQCIKTIKAYIISIDQIIYQPESSSLLVAINNAQLQIWNLVTHALIKTIKAQSHTTEMWNVAVKINQNQLASAGDQYSILLWNLNTGRVLATMEGHQRLVWRIKFNKPKQVLATSSVDSTVRIWSVTDQTCLMILKNLSYVLALDFNVTGTLLASGVDRQILIWETANYQLITTLQHHTDWIWAIEFSPDGQFLASGSVDRTICLWDVGTWQAMRSFEGHNGQVTCLAFNLSGTLLASGSGDLTVRVWDVATGKCLQILRDHEGAVWSVCWLDDHQLVSGGDDEAIRIWDTTTGACLHTLRPPRPYEGLNIRGATGLTEAQRHSLKALGAVA